jgi:serine/threonine protein kinase
VAEQALAGSAEFRPHLFGKFFVLQRLAAGGMAEVYRAKVVGAAGFEKELALKRILAQRAQDAGFIKMLVNEAKLTAQLTHSNIAQIYECGEVDGTYFIAMELVHGVSMKEMMAEFARSGVALTPEQAIFIVLQLLQGLDYAHRKSDAEGRPLRVVHCDVSPDNALVSWEGEIKLLDFGIARAATGLSNYKQGMLMGKLGYVAPEQASIRKSWDHRVDVFAAGIILFELLTGTKPFPKATDVDSLVASRKAEVPSPSSLDERIPKELDAIVARALAYRPEKRYPTARAFVDDLVDVLFPTPHSSIQDLLGQQIRSVFGETIVRQRAARAHDALVLKVLQHLADQEQAQAANGRGKPEPKREGGFQLTSLADASATPDVPKPAIAGGHDRRPATALPRRHPVTRPSGSAVRKALALGAALAIGAAGGADLTQVGVKGAAVGAVTGARVLSSR